MQHNPNSAAIAAFDICESLLLALVDHKVLTTSQVITVLTDAFEVHSNVPDTADEKPLHRETADRIRRLIQARNVAQ